MHVRRLDVIEDFRFDVTNLPGPRNPTDPLSRRGFADGDGPAPSTGDPDPESQQELFSLPMSRRTRAGVARGHPHWVGEHSTHRSGSLHQRPGGARIPLHTAAREGGEGY